MRKYALSLLATLSVLLIPQTGWSKNSKVDVGAGYRQDKLEWELAGPNDSPPVLSRLTWKQLRIFEMMALYKKITCSNIYFRARASYGQIFSGKNQDSDYRIDGETSEIVEFSRSNNNAGRGNVWDTLLGLGYFMRFEGHLCKIRLAPLGGFAIYCQNLRMFNGFLTIDLDNSAAEGHHIHHLHSRYDTTWLGPWLGLDAYFHVNEKITVNGSFEYHWLRYFGKGHWNLREDIMGDFHQHGFGRGYFGTLGVDYNFCSGWYLGGLLKYNYASLKNGRDHTPVRSTIVEGIQPNSLKKTNDVSGDSTSSEVSIVKEFVGKIRKVTWNSFSILFTAGYNF